MGLHNCAINTITRLDCKLAVSTAKDKTYVKKYCKVLLEEYLYIF